MSFALELLLDVAVEFLVDERSRVEPAVVQTRLDLVKAKLKYLFLVGDDPLVGEVLSKYQEQQGNGDGCDCHID